MFIKPDSSAAIAAFLTRGGSVKRIDTPTDAERVTKSMLKRIEDHEGNVTYQSAPEIPADS